MKIAIIAAIARNRVIGYQGSIPWHVSDDLRRFKKLTTGHAVVMGRRTFESLHHPLPQRRNIVISARHIPGVEVFSSLNAALDALGGEDRVFIIGGGKLYEESLPQAHELYLTFVDQEPVGDTFFPPFEHLLDSRFRLVYAEDHPGFHFRNYLAIPPEPSMAGSQ